MSPRHFCSPLMALRRMQWETVPAECTPSTQKTRSHRAVLRWIAETLLEMCKLGLHTRQIRSWAYRWGGDKRMNAAIITLGLLRTRHQKLLAIPEGVLQQASLRRTRYPTARPCSTDKGRKSLHITLNLGKNRRLLPGVAVASALDAATHSKQPLDSFWKEVDFNGTRDGHHVPLPQARYPDCPHM